MSQLPGPAPRHDAFEALRQRNFSIYASGGFLFGAALMLFQSSIAWQVYAISGSKLQLGLIGLVQFVPAFFGLNLIGGAFADSHDRRRTVIAAQLIAAAAAGGLMLATVEDAITLPIIYVAVVFLSLASSFENPARQALLPSVVTPEAFPNGITVYSTARQLGFVTGPAAGGLMIAFSGVGLAYGVTAALATGSILCITLLHPRPQQLDGRAVSVAAIKEGLQFVFRRQVLLGTMTLDLFAVIFGGATALLPVFATDVLHVGALGYGLLTASLDVGALLMAIALVFLPQVQRPGRAMMVAVAGFGLGTIVFGFSQSFILSLVAYMAVGAFDQISVVMRSTAVQLVTPDELRGRVSSVSQLFIGASNQLGRVESGFLAAATGAAFTVVAGGIACLGVLGVVAATMPDLRRYRISQGTMVELPDAEPATAAVGGN